MTYKSFIATLMAAALALTSASATPAKADDTAKFLAGVATLAIIGAAIADSKKNKRSHVTRHHSKPRHYTAPRRYYQPRHPRHRHSAQRWHRGHNGHYAQRRHNHQRWHHTNRR